MGILDKLGLSHRDNGNAPGNKLAKRSKARAPVEVYGSVQGSGKLADPNRAEIKEKIRKALS